MATLVHSGNKMPLGEVGGSHPSAGHEASVIAATKELAFPDGAVISLENFDSKGDRPGYMNTIAEMHDLSGKELQESYRAGLPMSAKYTEKVADR